MRISWTLRKGGDAEKGWDCTDSQEQEQCGKRQSPDRALFSLDRDYFKWKNGAITLDRWID